MGLTPAFYTPAIYSWIFNSCIFHPCSLLSSRIFNSPFSTPAIMPVPHFPLPHFQLPPGILRFWHKGSHIGETTDRRTDALRDVSSYREGYTIQLQEPISRLDSRTLRPVNVLSLLVFSNKTENGISDIRDIKRRIMAYP